MLRVCSLALALILSLPDGFHALAQEPEVPAVVHVKLLVAANGDDLGPVTVTVFQSEATGQDYAAHFKNNTAQNIPFGIYHLRAHHEGFYSADREVIVFQPDVWSVTGVQVGSLDGGRITASWRARGKILHLPALSQPVWVRLTSAYSTFIADARVDEAGNFSITGLQPDKCVLIIWTGSTILDTRPIEISSPRPLVIDLAQRATRDH